MQQQQQQQQQRQEERAGMPPKGCVAVRRRRFVVSLEQLSHPLFAELLDEAEREYGFEQKGAIVIPCHIDYFCRVQGMIDRDRHRDHHHHHHHHHHSSRHGQHGQHGHLHLPRFAGCFRA
ncbi:Auxin-responsive protein SAUR32 [Ananas comosus]|uniref:Auxin-responsive protein SAUR32 n=1 Tax=Ananas comosus TaxID=4615 RepID=A0A199UU83_ANACO|nr:Auxin-responsive protein SAUR32 [Ananas comosus]